MTARPAPPRRTDYAAFRPITTRWMDNDAHGHVNNVVFYSWFDTAVTGHLLETDAIDLEAGDTIGMVVETKCNYFAPVSFPETVTCGIRADRVGTSSVTYGVAIFREDDETAAAAGHFIHVYVDAETRRPAALPKKLRAVLGALRREDAR